MTVDRFEGKVVRSVVDEGSKSERDAVLLEVGSERFVLRRKGANPFSDAALDGLVGKMIDAKGAKHGTAILMDEWTEVAADGQD